MLNEFLQGMPVSIFEGKQVGELYHFTDIKGTFFILNENRLKGSMEMGKMFVSLTRDKFFMKNAKLNKMRNFTTRIGIDGTKLAETYKVAPYEYFYNNRELDWDDPTINWEMVWSPYQRLTNPEAEERVFLGKKKDIQNIAKYITGITVLSEGLENTFKRMRPNKAEEFMNTIGMPFMEELDSAEYLYYNRDEAYERFVEYIQNFYTGEVKLI